MAGIDIRQHLLPHSRFINTNFLHFLS